MDFFTGLYVGAFSGVLLNWGVFLLAAIFSLLAKRLWVGLLTSLLIFLLIVVFSAAGGGDYGFFIGLSIPTTIYTALFYIICRKIGEKMIPSKG
ncbi:hypothetical protein [Brevibacillus massiliensis]|uniref:hypothetical protein n=1 Tax=Brevibacillus massiliensis TaxID=1118054 RepID=UPI0002FF7029|nr:hypothetical protein [Brevibacillus massiliensis]